MLNIFSGEENNSLNFTLPLKLRKGYKPSQHLNEADLNSDSALLLGPSNLVTSPAALNLKIFMNTPKNLVLKDWQCYGKVSNLVYGVYLMMLNSLKKNECPYSIGFKISILNQE